MQSTISGIFSSLYNRIINLFGLTDTDHQKNTNRCAAHQKSTSSIIQNILSYHADLDLNLRLVNSTTNDAVATLMIKNPSRYLGIFENNIQTKVIEAVQNLDIDKLKFCLSYKFNFNRINNLKIEVKNSAKKSSGYFEYDFCNLIHLLFLTKRSRKDYPENVYLQLFTLLIRHGVDFNHRARCEYRSIKIENIIPIQFTEIHVLIAVLKLEEKYLKLHKNKEITVSTGKQAFMIELHNIAKNFPKSSLRAEYQEKLFDVNSNLSLYDDNPLLLPDIYELTADCIPKYQGNKL